MLGDGVAAHLCALTSPPCTAVCIHAVRYAVRWAPSRDGAAHLSLLRRRDTGGGGDTPSAAGSIRYASATSILPAAFTITSTMPLCHLPMLPQVDTTRFPLFSGASYMDLVISAGECLYIPPYWWHCIEARETSFSVSFWWQ